MFASEKLNKIKQYFLKERSFRGKIAKQVASFPAPSSCCHK